MRDVAFPGEREIIRFQVFQNCVRAMLGADAARRSDDLTSRFGICDPSRFCFTPDIANKVSQIPAPQKALLALFLWRHDDQHAPEILRELSLLFRRRLRLRRLSPGRMSIVFL